MGKFLKKLKFQKSNVGFKSDKQKIILTFSWMFSFIYRGPYKKNKKKETEMSVFSSFDPAMRQHIAISSNFFCNMNSCCFSTNQIS